MDRPIKMTGPTRSIYYYQVDQIENKKMKMIRKCRANGMIRAP